MRRKVAKVNAKEMKPMTEDARDTGAIGAISLFLFAWTGTSRGVFWNVMNAGSRKIIHTLIEKMQRKESNVSTHI